MKRSIIILLGVVLVLNGCAMIPKYNRPDAPIPADWPENMTVQKDQPERPLAPEIGWKEFFLDPKLQAVIDLALDNNRDLRVAALNIEKAQALYHIQRSQLNPGVGVLADVEKYRSPEKMSEDGRAEIVKEYSVNLGIASWELDLFGRLRSLKQRALEQFLATEQARSATQISLVAAVASSYLVLAADLENLQLAQDTLDAQKATFELISQSRQMGVASDLEFRQAESQMEAARVDVARYKGFIDLDKNALNILAGIIVQPELLPEGMDSVGEMRDISPGLSSDILSSRPDILMTEHQLQAMNANIGAARAAFFPRITLTLGGGTMSPDLSSLFGSGTGTWTFASQLVAPIWASHSLRANLKAAKVDRDIAVAQYEKAIQSAFREVSDSLALRISLTAQQEAQQSLMSALEETYHLSNVRYEAGIDGYLGVLVAQRAFYVAQQGLVATQLAQLLNRVTLYKVLGGGYGNE